MTKYLKDYILYINEKLKKCTDPLEIDEIMAEHKDKIQFMQHERIVHFLVTMMFAIILVIFIFAQLVVENIGLTILIILIMVLVAAYIKHYYFLENTVQNMYKIYDEILMKKKELSQK